MPKTSIAESPTDALVCEGVEYAYGTQPVLRGLDLRMQPGETYALLGGNGAGKSTALRLILGFDRPSAGAIRVCGVDVGSAPAQARRHLAYVPESVALYEHLSARENVDYFLALAEAPRGREVIDPALRRAALPEAAWDRRVGGFSKGMRQKVAIALAIARRTPVLLLDEPTSGLDPGATTDFSRLLQELNGEGVAILMVTHDLLGAADVADRIGFLANGRIDTEMPAEGPERYDVAALHRRYALGVAA
ncbi:ABC transporter ATP-binding protein [Marilutibacter alkalisoli]|uniref:ABC transporter ATP-binding protein n=1 Tax=Marilutibacter alkalisoli TaxID=2591633 RepID=A0A514BR62_9GAMM|nr:ABC transporter ATP-binding protein [Lysobacter alkalisoli]QDH69892.1 ABC transporter ATP-binding protein [Lysobacter alkalisoli]